MGFPLGKGGTFQEIAERASDGIYELVAPLLVSTGFLELHDGQGAFRNKFCKLHGHWPPAAGVCQTSIFMWNFNRASFWKDFVPMSEVRKVVRSMCLSRFRQALNSCFLLLPCPGLLSKIAFLRNGHYGDHLREVVAIVCVGNVGLQD